MLSSLSPIARGGLSGPLPFALLAVVALGCGGRDGPPKSDGGSPTDGAANDGAAPDGSAVDAGGDGGQAACIAPEATELFQILGPRGAEKVAIASDGAGRLGLLFFGEPDGAMTALRWAERSTDWASEQIYVSTVGFRGIDTAFASDGTPYAIYGSHAGSSDPITQISRRAPEGWSHVRLLGDQASETVAIVASPGGGIHAAYKDLYQLRYAYREGEAFTEEIVDDGMGTTGQRTVGLGCDLLVDGGGGVHMSYVSYAEEALYYARRMPPAEGETEGTWEKAQVDAIASEEPTSIAQTADGDLHISYRDAEQRSLSIASGTLDAFTVTAIAVGNELGLSSRILVDDSDKRYLLFHDRETGIIHRYDDSVPEFDGGPAAFEATQFDAAIDGDGAVWIAWITRDRALCLASY